MQQLRQPTQLFIVPTQDMYDDEILQFIRVMNFAPKRGSLCIALPEASATHPHPRVKGVYTVAAEPEPARAPWDWELELVYHPSPLTPLWWEITDRALYEGLVVPSMAHASGIVLTDEATITLIWELLGFVATKPVAPAKSPNSRRKSVTIAGDSSVQQLTGTRHGRRPSSER